MQCECPECSKYGGPNPRFMLFRVMVLLAQFFTAVVGLVRERSWKALAVTIGALAFFFTVPRYLICARCESYGENCYSLYLGKVTSMYLPKVDGKETSPVGAFMEFMTLSTLANAPAVGLRHNRRLLALYLLLANMTLVMQFSHACRHCSEFATGWKKKCPAAKLAGSVFGGRDVNGGHILNLE